VSEGVAVATYTLDNATGAFYDAARVFVVATSTTTKAGKPIPGPPVWRLRISVQEIGDNYTSSNVEFLS
jgi:hypothetical protein